MISKHKDDPLMKFCVETMKSAPLISEEIIEDYDEGFDAINSLSFRRRRSGKRSKNWSVEESDRFYEALTIVGNDFQAISTAFSQRSLAEIKRKFMRENKQNSQRIDQLLRVHESGESNWDLRKGFGLGLVNCAGLFNARVVNVVDIKCF